MASKMVDFPAPFRPMMPVTPSGNSMRVSLNFLKFFRWSVLRIMCCLCFFLFCLGR